jgi:hypothetical protein
VLANLLVCVMVEDPLAFDFSKTCTICDAFDEAWASLQGLGSDLTQASKSLATQTILAKRIIEMADQGLRDIPELRDDALAFLQHSPPSASRAGSVGETPRPATSSHSMAGKGHCREGAPSNSNFSGRSSFGCRAGTRGARRALRWRDGGGRLAIATDAQLPVDCLVLG